MMCINFYCELKTKLYNNENLKTYTNFIGMTTVVEIEIQYCGYFKCRCMITNKKTYFECHFYF